jgi:hypothetical protein
MAEDSGNEPHEGARDISVLLQSVRTYSETFPDSYPISVWYYFLGSRAGGA